MAGVGRRGLIGGGLGLAGVVGAGGFGAGMAAASQPEASPKGLVYELYGEHQPGIVTPVQDRMHFAAFDVITEDREELIALLKAWTTAADHMMRGEPAGGEGSQTGDYRLPPEDTGESVGLPAAGLTLTFGFGPTLFDQRFGLADRRPEALSRLPHFPADNLDPARSDGDLCIQACSDDPQVAVHAIRNLARIGFGTVSMRWSQLGFGRTSSTTRDQSTPRNLFGFKDGTMNLKAEEKKALDKHVWVKESGRADWLTGGSYLVARRINMTIEIWDRQTLAEQERDIGRTKAEGAPLSGGKETDQPDFALTGRGGEPLTEEVSHVALAHPDHNGGVRMLRRSYNFVDGSNAVGRMDAGLFFLAYVTDPRSHYIPMQTRMAREDLLMEYLQHTGSAIFAVPPGVRRPGDWIGRSLFS